MPNPCTLLVSAFGAVMEIALPDREFLRHGADILPAVWQEVRDAEPDMRFAIQAAPAAPGKDRGYVLQQNGELVRRIASADQARAWLFERLDFHLGDYARDCAFIHAGVVAHAGRAIVLPGATRAGKSTLTAALVRAGAQYISDDVALIGRDGQIYPHWREPSLRGDVADEFAMPLHSKSVITLNCPIPIAAILMARYEPGQTGLCIQPLSAGETVLRLLTNGMNARRHPLVAIDCCTAAAMAATCHEGVRGDAGTAAQLVLSMLTSPE